MEQTENKVVTWFKTNWPCFLGFMVSTGISVYTIMQNEQLRKENRALNDRNKSLEKENNELSGQVKAGERENRRLSRENGNLNYQLGKAVAKKTNYNY